MVIQAATWELIFLKFSQEIPKDSLILSAFVRIFLILFISFLFGFTFFF